MATPKEFAEKLGKLEPNETVRTVELLRNPTDADYANWVLMTDPVTKKAAAPKDYSDKLSTGEAELLPNDPNPIVRSKDHRSNETSSNDRKPLNQALDL